MHALAGIIVTPQNADIDMRMSKFCNYCGEEKPDAFCDGWAPVYIDDDGDLHAIDAPKRKTRVYCELLGNYHVRNVVNPYADAPQLGGEKYYPAELATLVSEDDQVYFDDDIEKKLDAVRNEHPDWGLLVINYHAL